MAVINTLLATCVYTHCIAPLMTGLLLTSESAYLLFLLSIQHRDTSKPGPWTLDWTVDWTVDSVCDDHYQSIGAGWDILEHRQSVGPGLL